MMNVKKVVLGTFTTALLLISNSLTPVLADSTKHVSQTQRQTIDMQTTKAIQNIIQLAKQGKLPNVPFQIGTQKSTIIKQWGMPKYGAEGAKSNKYSFLDYTNKKHTSFEANDKLLRIDLQDPTLNKRVTMSKLKQVVGKPVSVDGSANTKYLTYKAGGYTIKFVFDVIKKGEDPKLMTVILTGSNYWK
ncbi:DUF4309 domain-containing protein [Aneurinibacillus uraniidurans]|uniref:DUF4309 domain-containing protein n=1 Tax=Aneurinibacillus uraniidurans TaxID=2966586 RepID=UPI00234AFD49|nr:DUF4309 domain-containing protein [Aneurinibacillus sp. B1]WCN37907.1 DUF4309 domain-containing protein [Aneurinibacillus sp. B1]